jgi:hypothetical protein
MWLEIGVSELRVLNEKYEQIAVHRRRYEREIEPVIDFENYIGALSRKPRAFLSSPYFLTLPEPVQEHLQNCGYAELKQMLLTLVPIIRAGNIGDAAAVLELAEIRSTEDFNLAYRALTEDTRPLPSAGLPPQTPIQQPYLPKLDPYSALLGGGS